MFILSNICKAFRDNKVISGFTHSFSSYRTTVLIGSSGCGKSTLLKLMLGLIPIDSGVIEFNGQTISPQNLDSVRLKTGYVIQEGGLFPHLTARRNISLAAEYLHWNQAKIDARILELTALTQFPPDGLDRYPGELSGGQRQRVALMRGLMLDPEVLLLDEPLSSLDPLIRHDLQNDLKSIFAELNRTVIFVTHDIAEAAFIADEILLIAGGDILQKGTIDSFRENPASEYVTRFLETQRIIGESSP